MAANPGSGTTPGPALGEIANTVEHHVAQPSHPYATNSSSEYDDPKSISDDDTASEAVIGVDGHNAERVRSLARTLSHISRKQSYSGEQVNPFDNNKELDPELDPKAKEFNPRRWMSNIIGIKSRDPEAHPSRTAGISYKNLNVFGYGSAADYQNTVFNVWLPASLKNTVGLDKKRRIDILRNFEGLVKSGELLVVLGRPGSGCSTLLKTLAGETHGLHIDEGANLQYQGISYEEMHGRYRGETMYQAETEVHFPQMTVGETLKFAALARLPRTLPFDVSRDMYAEHIRDATMASFGLTHTVNTRVGNDFIRGVSGGERKRVSIAETALCGSPLQCWDNSTRGLDSATALEFVKTLRLSTEFAGSTGIVAIYQASQAIYDLFDKAVVLYEGRQIYFGPTNAARKFFIEMGFYCPERQTTADFLTSLTSPHERTPREGFENRVPRTPDEFAERWRASPERAQLLKDIDDYEAEWPLGGEHATQFLQSRKAQQAKRQREASPYTLSYGQQVSLCVTRGVQRMKGDMGNTLTGIVGNCVMGLIIASVFYNLPATSGSFYNRGALLFFAVLLNAFASALEIFTLYQQRPVVEKHVKYALYHPSAESFASVIVDLPAKMITAFVFNLILYFMTNLRREAGAFFIFFLFLFSITLTMSHIFRTIASVTRTLSQALVPTSLFLIALIIYTGFTIPVNYMLGWARWINYLDPVAYTFEAIMINEFRGRHYPCSTFIPAGGQYEGLSGDHVSCSVAGFVEGTNYVDGSTYISQTYSYYPSHLWRNLGIIWAFNIFFFCFYIYSSEHIASAASKGEVLVYPRGKVPSYLKDKNIDPEAGNSRELEKIETNPLAATAQIQKQESTFQWKDVCYDIKIKGEPRRILDHVDGWVKPGTLTALMGVSGAGKTTLLDCLASRVTMGVITGDMLVDGRQRDSSFQRKTGYVQQQDLHLETTTVREALIFSALLRQPRAVPREEKIAYVEEVIKMLDMTEYAEAVVGVPGEGLNVEQRKRLTIGVEMAAKPELLLFFDEPTSGLDSQTAWSICALMRKLANQGQAILCTIHQPSALLMQEFDRLLFLARGGRTVYFGELGDNMTTLIKYFENKGSHSCPADANPAEWMLEVIGAAPGSHTDIDWPEVWKESEERQEVRRTLDSWQAELSRLPPKQSKAGYEEFAAPLGAQIAICTKRVFEQYWRTPSYIYSKVALCTFTPLFIGFSFYNAGTSIQGLTNQLFAIFMLLTIFPNLCQQIMPYFITQRSLYEVRERPSKTFSWKAFLLANVFVEIPWNTLMAAIIFFTWYYPIGLYQNAVATDEVHIRGFLMFLLLWMFMMQATTFTYMVVVGMGNAETGSNVAQLLFSLCLIFCGVLATKEVLPGFWVFMYSLSPFTYLVSAILSTGLSNTDIVCAARELVVVEPVNAGQTCYEYMAPYAELGGGYLTNPNATSSCEYCSFSNTNQFLASLDIYYSDAWRNFGILFAYVIFNLAMAMLIYWWARVPKDGKKLRKQEKEAAKERKEGHDDEKV